MVTTRAMATTVEGGVSHLEEEKKDEHGDYFIHKHNIDVDVHDSSLQRKKKNTPPSKAKKKSPLLLLLCATGITSCYLWYGTVQEHVFHLDNNEEGTTDKQSITLFLLATGTFSSFLLAWVWTIIGPIILGSTKIKNESNDIDNKAEGAGGKKLNHALIVLTSLTYLSAMAASNESLHYVSYPTCVLAKSSKLIPTMIVGWLIDQWRSYSSRRSSSTVHHNNSIHHTKSINSMEWVGAVLITIGILSFQYIQLNKQSSNDSSHTDGKEVKGDSPYGLLLLSLSLFCDGLMAGCQSTLKQKSQPNNASPVYYRPPTAMETMLYINLYATLILLPASHYVGQFQRGMKMMFATNSSAKSMLLLQLNLSASLGQVFIFLTIHHFSPLTCTTITTTRKFFTILLSVYKFGHVLDIWQWGSVGLVFGGLYLEIVAKLVEQQHQHGEGDDDGDANIAKKKKAE